MTQKEKQLLLKDLCARLPYGVNAKCVVADDEVLYELQHNNGRECFIDINNIDDGDSVIFFDEEEHIDFWMPIGYIKPYLRPMSSMTDDEIDRMWDIYERGPAAESSVAVAEYLYERHLDCHYMIKKGLALEAPEGIYKAN